MADRPDIKELQTRVGHQFSDVDLLREALTHPSTDGPQNYQRLEFLGDRVLALVIADRLYERYPVIDEGALAQRLNRLVRRETLADVARGLALGPLLILSRSEREQGGGEKDGILADSCEALIAALYLDGGIECARRFIHRYWDPRLDAAASALKDPKSALQEWVQGRGRPAPEYEIIAQTGPSHRPHFNVRVRVRGLSSAEGEGGNRQTAEKMAASMMLAELGVKVADDD